MLWEKYESGWQKKVTVYGNKLFQRLPYEEWGLKSVVPLSETRRAEELERRTKSNVKYPSSILGEERVRELLKWYASHERQRYHRKWMWASLFGMPITAPVALLPVIPNLPFFWLVFRWWSHWRAQNGSKHVEFLLDNELLDLAPSSASCTLDTAYAVARVGLSLRDIDETVKAMEERRTVQPRFASKKQQLPEQMLLLKGDGALIAKCLEIPELGAEVERAVWQVQRSIKAQAEFKEEKAELDSVRKFGEKG